VVSECGRARSREDGRFRGVITRRRRQAGKRLGGWKWLKHAFGSCLPRPFARGWRWLSMVTKDTPGWQATRGEDWNTSGRQDRRRCDRLGDILNSGVVHICKAADIAPIMHYHRCYSACMTQIPQHLNNMLEMLDAHGHVMPLPSAGKDVQRTHASPSSIKTLKQPICRSKACLHL
jgi:hypothetical protein